MKMCKLIAYIIALLLIGMSQGVAQISINTLVLPPYQSRIADYASNPQLMLISITNTTIISQEIQLTARITGDNGISAWVKRGYRSPMPVRIEPGETITMNGNDIAFLFDINKIEYTGISRADMTRGLGLLEGNYTLCIQALDYKTLTALSPEQTGCNTFRISDLEPPRILTPFNAQKINNKGAQVIPMVWSTPAGSPPNTEYKVKIVEIIAPRNPNDAIQTTRPLVEEVVQGNTLVYGPQHPTLVPGRSYAMVVQATDPSRKSRFRNNGMSEVTTFVYGQDNPALNQLGNQPMQIKMVPVAYNPNCGCKVEIANNGSPLQELAVGSTIKVNHFIMNVVSVSSSNAGLFSGIGTITMPALGNLSKMIRLRVQFEDVEIRKVNNSELRLTQGTIQGIRRSNFSFMPTANNPELNVIPLSSSEINQIDQYFKNNVSQLLSNIENAANSAGFELPLGLDKGAFTIGITGVYFSPTQSWFEAVSVMNVPDANMKVAFSGRGICVDNNTFCKEAELYLSEDAVLGNTGLKLKGGAIQEATHITFDSKGFKELLIGASYTFPAGAPLLDAQTNSPLEAVITGRTEKGWSNWIGTAIVRPFKIGGMTDIIFGKGAGTEIIYDHSDIERAEMPNIIESGDAADAPIIVGPEWTGFYIPQIAIQMPNGISKINNKTLEITAKNIIYDEGICGNIEVSNLLSLGEGSLDGWYASIDQIGLRFWKNSFKQSYMNGELVLPPSGSDTSHVNRISYTSTLTKSASQGISFQMKALPKKGLQFSALWTTINIDAASNILVKGGGGESFEATATLHGDMVFKTNINKLPDLTLGELRFRNMELSTRPDYFKPGQIDFNTGHNSNASIWGEDMPDNLLAANRSRGPYSDPYSYEHIAPTSGGGSVIGFALTETRVQPYLENGHIGFRFGGALQLVKGASFIPKATVSFIVFGELDQAAAGKGRKFWKSVRGKLEHVQLDVNSKLGPVEVSGKLYYQDIVSGETEDRGLGARIWAKLPMMQDGFEIQALFGSRTTPSKKFNYFYMDASLMLPRAIPMFPGTAIFGFSGGFYYNMQVSQPLIKENLVINDMGTKKEAKDYDEPPRVQITSFSGNTYVPQSEATQGSNFGILAGVYFGLESKNALECLLAMDIGLNSSHGFSHFILDGQAAIMAGNQATFRERKENALASADIKLTIETHEETGNFKMFLTSGRFKMRYPLLTPQPLVQANGSFEFYIDDAERWYFHMGRPSVPNTILFANFLKSEAYFQIGNYNIEGMPPIPTRILEIMGTGNARSTANEDNGFDAGPDSMIEGRDGNAMALGKGFNFGAKVEIKADPSFLIFYASIYAGLGFDVQISQINSSNASCGQKAGDWYARGQVFVGAEAACGVRVNIFGLKKEIEFVRAGLAATMDMGGPSPLYAAGTIGGRFSVLDGLIGGSFNIRVQFGKACPEQSSRELKLISDIKPDEKEVNLLTRPIVAFNYPLNKDFVVPITTQDEDGNIRSVNYEVYRFRKDYVNINVSKNGQQIFSGNDFVAADENGEIPSYRQSMTPYYMLALGNDKAVLDKNSEYKVFVAAKVKVLKLSTVGGYFASKQIAYSQAALNNPEDNFDYVTFRGSKKIYEDIRKATFKTDDGPKRLPLESLADVMPVHRHKSLPYQVLPNGKGYLRLSNGWTLDKFDTKLNNVRAFARVVSVDDGQGKSREVPVDITEGGKLWSFNMPPLLPNKNYAIRFFLKGDGDDSGSAQTHLVAKVEFGEGKNKAQLNNREIIGNLLKMGPLEQELFSWYFATGGYKTYTDKLNALELTYLYLDDKKIDVNTPTVNLQNYSSYSDVINISLTKLDLDYFGDEYFNKLDEGEWKVGDIFPDIGNSNRNIKLGNKNYVGYFSLTPPEVPEMQRIIDEFADKAFAGQKELVLNFPHMEWNALVGGISTRYSSDFNYLSSILPANLYGIGYLDNNYAIATQSTEEFGPPEDESAETSRIGTILSNSVGMLNLSQLNSAALNSHILAKKHVYTTNITTFTQSGKGVVEASNIFIQKVNLRKDQGYPIPMVKELGVVMDRLGTVTQASVIQIPAVKGFSQPIMIR